jgi:hypothetical protein
MAIIKTNNLFNKFPSVTSRSLAINSENIMDSTTIVTTDSISYALDNLLQQKCNINDTDVIMIYDLKNEDITFFIPPKHSDLQNLRGITIDP